MTDERWSDERLDEVIDATARRMTDGAPRRELAGRIARRLEARSRILAPAWQIAAAAALILVVAFSVTRLLHHEPTQSATMPKSAPVVASQAPESTTPRVSIGASPVRAPRVVARRRQQMARRVPVAPDAARIPPLDVTRPLSVDALTASELGVAPVEIAPLSVTPLERDGINPPR